MERASLSYIFFTFLKLGATAFGGYMSLVAIVQKQLVEVDKKLMATTIPIKRFISILCIN